MAHGNITKDILYDAVAPDDFESMLELDRYNARSTSFYATYVDMDELKSEGEKMVGDDIAGEGIKYLQEINFKDRATKSVSIAAE